MQEPTVCYEIVTFRPAPGCSAEQVRQGFAPSQAFLESCPGYRARHLLAPADDGETWLDVVQWESRAAAMQAMAAFENHPAVASIMAVVDPSSVRMEHRDTVSLVAA